MTSPSITELWRFPDVTHGPSVWISSQEDGLAGRLRTDLAGTMSLLAEVDGHSMQTEADLYQEFASAFQFPEYFGKDSGAFDECLTDLDWLAPFTLIVLVIRNPVAIMRGNQGDLAWFLRRIKYAQREWAGGGEFPSYGSLSPVPFRVLLEAGLSLPFVDDLWGKSGAILASFSD